nr:MAG TPA: Endodeoxyribonuclease RusA [Caudoviricetes sp.]
MNVCFDVPGKPQGKGRPRFTRSGHTYTPDRTVEYEGRVKLAYKQAGGGKLSGFVSADILAVFTVPKSYTKAQRAAALNASFAPKKPDCDNIAKIILDALNSLAYDDDAQVVKLRVEKRYGETEHVLVVLEEGRET